jgi:hypothetical protein
MIFPKYKPYEEALIKYLIGPRRVPFEFIHNYLTHTEDTKLDLLYEELCPFDEFYDSYIRVVNFKFYRLLTDSDLFTLVDSEDEIKVLSHRDSKWDSEVEEVTILIAGQVRIYLIENRLPF